MSSLDIRIEADDLANLLALDSECGVRETFVVRFEDMTGLDWETLTETFAHGKLHSLKRVNFEGRGDHQKLQRFLEDGYPELTRLVHLVHAYAR